jgi:hypothetical protein
VQTKTTRTDTVHWQPYANGPQEKALKSEAFVVGYGGAAGGGKTDLVLGAAATGHRKTHIFRREYDQLDDMIERSMEILDGVATFNKSTRIWKGGWRGQDGKLRRRTIKFAAIQRIDDLMRKWRGRTRDLLAIDEATEWPELMIRSLMGWVRSPDPNQRCRVILTFNPPTSAEGMWVVEFFGPWLDDKHPNPAKAGEIRWFARIGDKDVEVPDSTPVVTDEVGPDGEKIIVYPQSRTFFPALLKDNPILAKTSYDQTLSSLPEPLRSQLRNGDFKAGIQDDAWQVIPTRWVELAQERWRKSGGRPRDAKGELVPLSCLGVDPSRGGAAKTAIAPRYDDWFGTVVTHQGASTDEGEKVAGLVMEEWAVGAAINIDVTGIGSSAYDSLRKMARLMEADTNGAISMTVRPINSAEGSKLRDKSGKYRLVNVRAAQWWMFREALDPQNNPTICLPPDSMLKADLCAPRWKITAEGIMIEPKYSAPGQVKGVADRLGRSPDVGEAVLLAYWMSGVSWFVV